VIASSGIAFSSHRAFKWSPLFFSQKVAAKREEKVAGANKRNL
jgi:hypothetical protein